MSKLKGYSPYPNSGWISYGRLIINYHHNRVLSIFFNGVQLLGGAR